MVTVRRWESPTGAACPQGHVVWLCTEQMAAQDLVLERRGSACRDCRWDELPAFGGAREFVEALPER